MRKSTKQKQVIFVLLALLLSSLFLMIHLRKTGYAYKIQFMQPHILKERVIEELKTINQSYLDGIHTIEVVDMPVSYEGKDYDGLYILGGRIRINVKDGFRKEVLLHELKHHHCWKKERYLGHEDCFKEPPLIIDEQVTDQVIVPHVTKENLPSCFDNMKNQNETGIDCGGVCVPCEKETVEMFAEQGDKYIILSYLVVILTVLMILFYAKAKKRII